MFLEISQNSQENTFARASFLIKLQAEAYNFIKRETLARVFFCEFCEISWNTFFTEHHRATASEVDLVSVIRIKFHSKKKCHTNGVVF